MKKKVIKAWAAMMDSKKKVLGSNAITYVIYVRKSRALQYHEKDLIVPVEITLNP